MRPHGVRPRVVALALVAAAVVAGAGADRQLSRPSQSDAGALPPTDGVRAPARCPAAPGDTIEFAYDEGDIALLTANRDVVLAYSRTHLNEYGGYQYADGQPRTLRVAFTDHVGDHDAALRGMVPFPARLDVVRAERTMAELESVFASLSVDVARPERRDVVSSLAVGWQAVDLRMNPGLEDLARRYAERFGSGVRISIGGHVYLPAQCGGHADTVRCAGLVGAPPSSAGLTLALVAETASIAAAQTGRARLVVHNVGSRRFTIDSGTPMAGSLVLPGTDTVVGSWSGTSAGVGGGVDLRPGERGEIAVVFGASRCDGGPGSALPPGRYGLRVVLSPEGGGEPRLVSPETIVTVTANPAQPA